MTKALYLLAAVVMATPLAAQSTPQAQPIQADPKKGDANKIVCKSEDTIGSRLGAKKVCLTVQEWKEQADFYRDQTESWQRQSPARSSGG